MTRMFTLAALLAGAVATPTLAADAISYPLSNGEQVALVETNAMDWNGFYAGVMGAMRADAGGADFGAGLVAGGITTYDFFVLGGEVAAYGLTDGTNTAGYGQVLARGGVLVTENILAYATAGYGLDLSAGTGEALVGGGLELGVTDSLSLRAQYLRGVPVNGGGSGSDQFSLGAVFHF